MLGRAANSVILKTSNDVVNHQGESHGSVDEHDSSAFKTAARHGPPACVPRDDAGHRAGIDWIRRCCAVDRRKKLYSAEEPGVSRNRQENRSNRILFLRMPALRRAR